ncbi:MAG: ABC transporter ATP-binding protein [Planctomycetaceae bacterium]
MTEPAISVRNVSRRFGSNLAVNDLSLEVPSGSVFGLVGTNGAGKTTLIRMLVGHLHCDSGSVDVLGSDPWTHGPEILQRIAYVSDSMQLPPRMTIAEVLKLNRGFFPNWETAVEEALVEEFKLPTNQKYASLSFGQRRRAVLLQALAQGADLLILDEPAGGLDPLGRRQFLETMLAATVDRGQTVLFSSHMLGDIERVVDRIAVMSGGRLQITGDLETLKATLRRVRIEGVVDADDVRSRFNVLEHRVVDGITNLLIDGFDETEWQSFTSSLGKDMHAEAMNLEDMFVELAAK